MSLETSLTAIAALAANGAIGKNNQLLWHLPKDMAFFKKQTSGQVVIMGRKSYESLPKAYRPLPNRTNIVLSTSNTITDEGVIVVESVEKLLEVLQQSQFKEQEKMVIGGGEIYKILLPYTDTMYLTHVHTELEGDVFFPAIEASNWQKEILEKHLADDRHLFDFDFCKYTRIK